MKIIVNTSNSYHHLIPIFCFLFNRNWDKNQQVEIIGYDKPTCELPPNFSFVSMGEQIGGATNFTTDLKKHFKKQDQYFIWLFEDSWIKSVDFEKLEFLKSLTLIPNLGRINLSYAGRLQDHFKLEDDNFKYPLIENTQTALYRLCTQPSIWNRDFLLQYMQTPMTPWQFETQKSFNDGWRILGLEDGAVIHNEGVTKHDIHKYDLNGIPEEVLVEMVNLKLIDGKDILK